jgi:hypothetical protein
LISFFLNGLFLEGKCILVLKFICCLGVYLKLCLRSKVNLGFHKYVDGDQSWMYESSDVLAHFKGVSIFLEATA